MVVPSGVGVTAYDIIHRSAPPREHQAPVPGPWSLGALEPWSRSLTAHSSRRFRSLRSQRSLPILHVPRIFGPFEYDVGGYRGCQPMEAQWLGEIVNVFAVIMCKVRWWCWIVWRGCIAEVVVVVRASTVGVQQRNVDILVVGSPLEISRGRLTKLKKVPILVLTSCFFQFLAATKTRARKTLPVKDLKVQ